MNKELREIKKINREIERAILFLLHSCFDGNEKPRKLKTTKPLVMHSLRIVFKLLNYGYSKEVVMGAMFHDLIEDAGVSLEDVKKRFGSRVAKLVSACSFDETISDQTKRYKELYGRVKKAGHDAFVVTCADILDNSDYFRFSKKQARLLKKWKYFLNLAKEDIQNEPIYQELKNNLRKISSLR